LFNRISASLYGLMFALARNSLYNGINVWRFTLLRDRQLTSVGQGSIYHPVAVRATEYFSIQLSYSLMITVSSFNYGDFDQIQIRDWVFNVFLYDTLTEKCGFVRIKHPLHKQLPNTLSHCADNLKPHS